MRKPGHPLIAFAFALCCIGLVAGIVLGEVFQVAGKYSFLDPSFNTGLMLGTWVAFLFAASIAYGLGVCANTLADIKYGIGSGTTSRSKEGQVYCDSCKTSYKLVHGTCPTCDQVSDAEYKCDACGLVLSGKYEAQCPECQSSGVAPIKPQ